VPGNQDSASAKRFLYVKAVRSFNANAKCPASGVPIKARDKPGIASSVRNATQSSATVFATIVGFPGYSGPFTVVSSSSLRPSIKYPLWEIVYI
jgi:hypothetical protein